MVRRLFYKYIFLLFLFSIFLFSSSCSRFLGYGVLLWSVEDPPVPSGTVLPVYIKSNINQVWVVGIPKEFRTSGSNVNKFEIPLAKLELSGSRKKAQTRAEGFAPYAILYAETLQDGLPIRDSPDNGARRVYRLKLGEVIKVLSLARGTVAVGATGDPLPGEWYRVLTEDGTSGFCFSYRLKIFEHVAGPLAAVRLVEEEADPVLDKLLERTWSPESYGAMLNSQRIDLEELSQKWNFDPGQDTGIAIIKTADLDLAFSYSKIRSTGTQSWRFEGTQLQMNLRSENTLAVQFLESNGILRTVLFVALSSEIDDIILQESVRREGQFRSIIEHGNDFSSNNYGNLVFTEDGNFTWTGNTLLVPQVIPASALGRGKVDMRLYLADTMGDRYNGAITLNFDAIGASAIPVDFLYTFDSQGMRFEYAPKTSLDGVTVVRRASSPLVMYFFKNEGLDDMAAYDFAEPFTPYSGN